MKVNKFKKVGRNKYKVFFDNTELLLYEDIILKYELLTRSDIDTDLIDEILIENRWYDAYDRALSYIEVKMRNRKEIIKYLERYEYDQKTIESVIDKLDEIGLLNDKRYIEAYVNDKVNLTNDGPYKIKNSLIDLDFDESDINHYLNNISYNTWLEKLEKIVNKKKSIMKSKSYFMFIQKMKNDLYNLGYHKDMIEEVLSKIEYESNAIDKDFEKANKKYNGEKTKIVNYLLRKGYSYDEINGKIKNTD